MVMSSLPDLSSRFYGAELMDDPEFSGAEMGRVLRNLKKINSLLGNYKNTLNAVLSVTRNNHQTIHIVDLGCGGGDLMCFLSKSLKKKNIPVRFTGIDFNPNITGHAASAVCNYNNISFVTADILSPKFELPTCDLLISSHFVYRFSDSELQKFISVNESRIGTAIIFSELRRSRLAYLLFSIFGRLIFRSRVTLLDGLTAIRRSFTIKEMNAIIKQSGKRAEVLKKPFFRQIALVHLK